MANTQIIADGISKYQNAPIRVTVAAAVAFNGDAFKTSIAGLMERLGCGKCFSGFDCRFMLQRDYVINPQNKIEEIRNDTPSSLPVVNIRIDKATSHDLGKITSLVERLRGKFGCLPCHSGFDFRFRNEIRELSLAEIGG